MRWNHSPKDANMQMAGQQMSCSAAGGGDNTTQLLGSGMRSGAVNVAQGSHEILSFPLSLLLPPEDHELWGKKPRGHNTHP